MCHFLVAFCVALAFSVTWVNAVNPVVIVPGLSASALYEREGLLKIRRWVNEEDIAFKRELTYLPCTWEDGYLQSVHKIHVYPGLSGVCNISGDVLGYSNPKYREFWDLVDAIQTRGGAVGAVPYDWRLVPQQDNMELFVEQLVDEITTLYYNNSEQQVYIVAHSLGNLMTLYFLDAIEQVRPGFAKQYIKGYFAVSPPFGGAGMGLQAVLGGIIEEPDIEFPAYFLGGFASFPWVFPQQRAFKNSVIYWNGTEYHADQIPQFVHSYKFDSGSLVPQIYQYIVSKFNYSILEHAPVGVNISEIYVSYCQNISTCNAVSLTDHLWIEFSEQLPPFGDGTVPRASLTINNVPWQIHHIQDLEGCDHSSIIQDERFITNVLDVISAGV